MMILCLCMLCECLCVVFSCVFVSSHVSYLSIYPDPFLSLPLSSTVCFSCVTAWPAGLGASASCSLVARGERRNGIYILEPPYHVCAGEATTVDAGDVKLFSRES